MSHMVLELGEGHIGGMARFRLADRAVSVSYFRLLRRTETFRILNGDAKRHTIPAG